MIPKIQLIRKVLIQRKALAELQTEVEALQTELLATDYEINQISSWFQGKKKQKLQEKRAAIQACLVPLEEKLQGFPASSLFSLTDSWPALNVKQPAELSERIAEILNFAIQTELYLTALTELDKALNECFVEQINVWNQAAVTNKTINLSPVLPLLSDFLDHDARYRSQLHQFNRKKQLPGSLHLRKVDFERLTVIDKRSELRFLGKQCQPLKAELQMILRQLEDQIIYLTSAPTENPKLKKA